MLDGTLARGADYEANKKHMDQLMSRHNQMIEKILQGGGEKAQMKLRKRNKLFVRERYVVVMLLIRMLL